MCVCVCVCVCVCKSPPLYLELTHSSLSLYIYLGILPLAVNLGDDTKQSLQFPQSPGCLVDRGGIMIHVQVLEWAESRGWG